MLYHVLEYDNKTGIAYGIKAAHFDLQASSGLIECLFSEFPLQPNMTYSFIPKREFVGGVLIKGTIDKFWKGFN